MRYPRPASNPLGRRRHLALALALALGGSLASTAAASPGSTAQTQSISAAELQARYDAQEARLTQRAADAAHASSQTMGTTRYVANCNDSGSGSLRDTIANAASGDTIDMSTMSCNTINLDSTIIVPQDDLTVVGKRGTGLSGFLAFPDTYITVLARAFFHSGAGTLTLTYLDLSTTGPSTASGACVYTESNVVIDRSYIHDCLSERSDGSTGDARGGAIYADGYVRLSGSSIPFASARVYDNVAKTGTGNAYGGGIYAGSWVRLDTNSRVYGNRVESVAGNATGGGIYSQYYVSLSEASSSVHDNKAQTRGELTRIRGAGIYAQQFATIFGSVTGNRASYLVPGGTSVYRAQGGGIYAETGVTATGANIRDNSGVVLSGGGIFTNGYLSLQKSTVADNSGKGTGALFAKGNTTIIESTVSGNTSQTSANIKVGPDATNDILIRNSTISSNIITNSSTNGAALNLQHDATIEYSTITGNVEKNDSDTKYGAGISLDSNVNVALLSTIVSGNGIESSDGNTKYGSDVFQAKGASGGTITGSHNLIQFSIAAPSDTISATPNLGPLADNGGPTRTHEPCRNSQAIDNGAQNNAPSFDQRGSGFPRWMGFNVDIGAIEAPDYSDIIFRNGFEEGGCGG